jgi:hypothetical protein
MKTLKFKLSEDTRFILNILKEEKVLTFEKNVPYFLIAVVYDFIWNLLFKAKILSKYKGKKGIDVIDMKIAFIIKIRKTIRFDFSTKNLKHITNLINKQNFPPIKNISAFKFLVFNKSLTNGDYKILGNILNL